MLPLVLGSQSPRRKEILGFFDIPFEQISPNFDEEAIPFEGDPEVYVSILSKGKADSLSTVYPNATILTADTIVYREHKVYGKPKDKNDAIRIIGELSGQWHSVYTGLTLWKDNEFFHKVEKTNVLFNTLTLEQIHHYIERCHWADKAGGYGIQTGGGLPINKIDGCYYNVMGLPTNALRELFLKIGIDLWQHIKK